MVSSLATGMQSQDEKDICSKFTKAQLELPNTIITLKICTFFPKYSKQDLCEYEICFCFVTDMLSAVLSHVVVRRDWTMTKN